MSGVVFCPVQLTIDQNYLEDFLTGVGGCLAKVVSEEGAGGDCCESPPDKAAGLRRVGGEEFQLRSYNVKVPDDLRVKVDGFLEDYRTVLRNAIEAIWSNIRWVNDRPILPKDNRFKKELRNLLLRDWCYYAHYVDSALRVAYGIMKGWRRRYCKGLASREKPIVMRRFIRVRRDLYRLKGKTIVILIRPGECIELDVSRAWFWSRVPGSARMGELILGEKHLTITFRIDREVTEMRGVIGWDLNERSIDGYNPELGWIRISTERLVHIHSIYGEIRSRLQERYSKRPTKKLRKIMEKYSGRERDRTKDFCHKLTTRLSREFGGYIHAFEDLDKQRMYNNSKGLNRMLDKTNWKTIVSMMRYKSMVRLVDPRNTSCGCPVCGANNSPNGDTYRCSRCGFEADRQLVGAVNVYMRAVGLKPGDLDLFILPSRPAIVLDEAWVYGYGPTRRRTDENPHPPSFPRGLSPLLNVEWAGFSPVGGGAP